MTHRSEDTIIFNGLTHESINKIIVYGALRSFFEKKREIDSNYRFNFILFKEDGPIIKDFTTSYETILKEMKALEPEAFEKAGIKIA